MLRCAERGDEDDEGCGFMSDNAFHRIDSQLGQVQGEEDFTFLSGLPIFWHYMR